MKILIMTTADYAAVEPQSGKLNILGTFDTISARVFPVTHPRMCLVLKFEGQIGDTSPMHKLSVAFADVDGNELFRVEGQFEMSSQSPGVPPQHAVVMEFNDLSFARPGEYRVYVTVDDGALEESAVLRVVSRER